MFAMMAIGFWRALTGTLQPVESPAATSVLLQDLTLFFILRAFSAGCTALTGVEAIADGVPAFHAPQADNAGRPWGR